MQVNSTHAPPQQATSPATDKLVACKPKRLQGARACSAHCAAALRPGCHPPGGQVGGARHKQALHLGGTVVVQHEVGAAAGLRSVRGRGVPASTAQGTGSGAAVARWMARWMQGGPQPAAQPSHGAWPAHSRAGRWPSPAAVQPGHNTTSCRVAQPNSTTAGARSRYPAKPQHERDAQETAHPWWRCGAASMSGATQWISRRWSSSSWACWAGGRQPSTGLVPSLRPSRPTEHGQPHTSGAKQGGKGAARPAVSASWMWLGPPTPCWPATLTFHISISAYASK